VFYDNFGFFFEEGTVIRIVLKFMELLGQHGFHFYLFFGSAFVVIPFLALHEEKIDYPCSFAACPASALYRPDWRMPSFVADNAINFSNVQTFLANGGRYESVDFSLLESLDDFKLFTLLEAEDGGRIFAIFEHCLGLSKEKLAFQFRDRREIVLDFFGGGSEIREDDHFSLVFAEKRLQNLNELFEFGVDFGVRVVGMEDLVQTPIFDRLDHLGFKAWR
jgi:hypothetical protein